MAIMRFPKQLQEYYITRLRKTYAQRRKTIDAIRTRKDAAEYRDRTANAIKRIFRPHPKKTPLNAQTLKISDFGDYTVEHVIYESRPGYRVTANLYLPKTVEGKIPGVLFPCGHSNNGKAHPVYVTCCIRLVREGYAVLIYDPIGQGERDVFSALKAQDRPTRDAPCTQHNIVGKQLAACGDYFGMWRAWDGIRGTDYLVSRPEVDSMKLAVTGQSGGGTLSAYIWALEPRMKAVASSCWTTSYLNDIENGMPADNEQYPPGFIAAGLDKIDFFTSRAGEPVLLIGQEFDFFDDRGMKDGHRDLKKLHTLLGGDRRLCQISLDTQTHTYSDANQREMLAFFNRVFGKRKPAVDRRIDPPDESRLKVTPECDVHKYGSTPIYKLIAQHAEKIVAERKPVPVKKLPGVIRKALKIRLPADTPHHRRLFQTGTVRESTGQAVYRFIVESQPGIQCVLRRIVTPETANPFRLAPKPEIHLYLPNLCSQADLEKKKTMKGIPDFWALDVRGLGEGTLYPEDPLKPYGNEYMMAGHALLYGETLLGDRVFDVLSAIRLLCSEGAETIHLTGRGQGAILAMLAGVLDKRVASVTSLGAPESIFKMVTAPLNTWPTVNFPKDVLKYFDLPDVRHALGKRLIHSTTASPVKFKP